MPRGRILPWYSPKPSVAYDHAIRAVWRFWQAMPMCPNDVRYFLQHQVWKPGAEDPRGLGGDQLAMALSSWNLLHGYLGDPSIVTNMRYVADYYLAHGLSSPASKWPNLPFPYNVDLHGGTFDGDMRAGRGFLQPDKAGSFGAELVTLAKVTGDTRYLAAAARMADTLAAQVVGRRCGALPVAVSRARGGQDDVRRTRRPGPHIRRTGRARCGCSKR